MQNCIQSTGVGSRVYGGSRIMNDDIKRSGTSAELVRQFGQWRHKASHEPLYVTHHGRDTHVLLTADTYNELISEQATPPSQSSEPRWMLELASKINQGFFICDGELRVRAVNSVVCAVA